MSTRELILLSPNRIPTQGTLYLSDEEVAAFLNGHAALWHPAALQGAVAPPQVASPYDFEQPRAGHIYAVPQDPPPMLPDDWEQQARAAGACVFHATPDRQSTLCNLTEALRAWSARGAEATAGLLELPAALVAPFLGLGFGHLQLAGLFEAMSHENILSGSAFWQDICAAIAPVAAGDAESARTHLERAAGRLLAARESLYPVAIHIVDLVVPDPKQPVTDWPLAPQRGQPINFVACAALLQQLTQQAPERFHALRSHIAAGLAEVCGGCYAEREDPLLPLESQLWNLQRGLAVSRELLGQQVRVFARRRFGFHQQLPSWLQAVGIGRAILVAFDDAVLPAHRAPVIAWQAGAQQVEAFTRTPHAANSPQTFFHLAYHLHQTIMQDQAATLALLHSGKPPSPGYEDWLELTRLAPVLGRWSTLSSYFDQVLPGDYTEPASADEFHGEYLVERTSADRGIKVQEVADATIGSRPVSFFASQLRQRRRVDTCLTLAAFHAALGSARTGDAGHEQLAELEDRWEEGRSGEVEQIDNRLAETAATLARRLVARGATGQRGYMVLNPCSFRRRVVITMPGTLPPLGGPVKAVQSDGQTSHVIAEVPALGFAWLPRDGGRAVAPSSSRMRLADEHCVRNEYFEAEVDPQTGGLRAIRDMRTRAGRMGQQLVFNPGSTMRLRQMRTTATGPALGEIISEGVLLDAQDQVISTYRQRFRAWLGRPVLELRIELEPAHRPDGYPWHAYYAARFAWREERSAVLRGVNGLATLTSHSRPESPDFLEIRMGRQNVVLFPGGLPFHQRHGGRMLDILLICPGETCQAFDLGIGLDREYPMQTAVGFVTPAPVVPVDRGPPPVGQEGWLFHLDAANVLLSSLRPAANAVTARLLEYGGVGANGAQLRCPRDPVRATLVNARGTQSSEAAVRGDAVVLNIGAGELVQARIEFA